MVDQSERDEMARIMRVLSESNSDNAVVPVSKKHAPHVSGIVPESNLAPNVADMKSIMEKIQRASDGAVEHLDRKASEDHELREALDTQETSDGARIGEWEIRTHGQGKRKFYDVGRINESTVIAADLTLYEAAYGLVKILNEGGTVNSRQAMSLMNAEQSYTGAVTSMVRFKHLIENGADDDRRALFEDRYGEAKRKAIQSRNKIVSMTGLGPK